MSSTLGLIAGCKYILYIFGYLYRQCACTCAYTVQCINYCIFFTLFKFWGCSMVVCQSCKCVSSILQLCVRQKVCVCLRACVCLQEREQEKGAGSGRVWKENDRKVALLSTASHPEVGQRTGGEREELRGLVGWRRGGSPTAMDTQTHRNRHKEDRMGTSWINVL